MFIYIIDVVFGSVFFVVVYGLFNIMCSLDYEVNLIWLLIIKFMDNEGYYYNYMYVIKERKSVFVKLIGMSCREFMRNNY